MISFTLSTCNDTNSELHSPLRNTKRLKLDRASFDESLCNAHTFINTENQNMVCKLLQTTKCKPMSWSRKSAIVEKPRVIEDLVNDIWLYFGKSGMLLECVGVAFYVYSRKTWFLKQCFCISPEGALFSHCCTICNMFSES